MKTGRALPIMKPSTYDLTFKGELLNRGFWLDVWDIELPDKTHICYVGRTGDSSSSNAKSPFNRMSQHPGFNAKSNVLRRCLNALGIDPAKCMFRLVANGPVLPEMVTHMDHQTNRDQIAALEKALADAMTLAGYDVINKIACRKSLDEKQFSRVWKEFAVHFPKLSRDVRGHQV
jgi:hypothetical protein